MRLYKVILLTGIIMSTALLSGCWDNIEINKRGFVMGIGLDEGVESNLISATYEIALPSKMVSSGGGDKGGGQEGSKATWDITKMDTTVLEINHLMFENIDKVIDLEHMQVVIVGRELAKRGIIEDIDFFFRYPQVRRRTSIVYTDLKAADILKTEPKTTKSPALFISDVINSNTKHSHGIASPIDIGKLEQYVRENYDFLLPKVNIADNTPQINGGAAFRNGKFVCDVNREDLEAVAWVNENVTMGDIQLSDPENPSKILVYEISGGTGKIKPAFAGERIIFNLDIKMEGDIGEREDTNYLGAANPSYINAVEISVEDTVKSEVAYVYNKYERENKVDIFGLKRKIKNYNNKYYEDNRDVLNEILANSEIKVNVSAKIRRLGLSK